MNRFSDLDEIDEAIGRLEDRREELARQRENEQIARGREEIAERDLEAYLSRRSVPELREIQATGQPTAPLGFDAPELAEQARTELEKRGENPESLEQWFSSLNREALEILSCGHRSTDDGLPCGECGASRADWSDLWHDAPAGDKDLLEERAAQERRDRQQTVADGGARGHQVVAGADRSTATIALLAAVAWFIFG